MLTFKYPGRIEKNDLSVLSFFNFGIKELTSN